MRFDRFLTWLAERPGATRWLTVGAVVLMVGAVATLAYPVVTDVYHDSLRGKLDKELASPTTREAYLDGTVASGQSLTRLQIPKLGVNVVVVQGVSTDDLKAGAGHYPETPMPCDAGDVAVAGHRTTYGKPFANVDRLRPGDQIVLRTPVGSCVYEVERNPFVVLPTDLAVVSNTPRQFELTLTACDPKGSASHRIVVKAMMVSSTTPV